MDWQPLFISITTIYTMNQREVWDNIADDWNNYRKHPPKDSVKFLENKRGIILDLACGSGRNFIKINGIIIGLDFSTRMLRLSRNKIKNDTPSVFLAAGDAVHLPFKDNIFDNILFSNSFHCVKWNHREKVLREIKRVSKNGAQIYISVWNRDQPRFETSKKESYIEWTVKGKRYQRYYYLYSKDELEALMKKYFKNVKVFGGGEKAFKKYSKNIIAIAKVKKTN